MFLDVALASLTLFSGASETPNPLVYGGEVVEACGWPSVVSLPPGCTGTLIHPEIILYAAHCTADFDHVRFGERFHEPARSVPVEYCVVNPASDGLVNERDYAYCKLAEPVVDVTPTPPALGCELDALELGGEVTIVGFGYFQPNSPWGIKHEATPWVSALDVEAGWMRVGGDGQTVCNGDSGGPTFVRGEDGVWRSVAIASGIGGGCGTGSGYHVLSKNAVEWVEEASGVDVTPCFDADGTWNPSEACQGFALDPGTPHGSWADGCSGGALSGPLDSCGPAFNAPPDHDPPKVTITNPVDGTRFEDDPATFDLEIEADDGEGWGVVEVYVRINGEEQPAYDHEAPFEFPNVTFAKGTYEIVAVAEDFYGTVGESEPVTIYVDQPVGEGDGGDDGDGGSDDNGDESGEDEGTSEPGDEDGGAGDLSLDETLESGCGCGSSRSRGGAGLLFGLVLIGLIRRR